MICSPSRSLGRLPAVNYDMPKGGESGKFCSHLIDISMGCLDAKNGPPSYLDVVVQQLVPGTMTGSFTLAP